METDTVVITLFNLAGAFFFAYLALSCAEEAFESLSHGDYVGGLVVLPFSALFGFLSIACLSAIRDAYLEES